MLGIIDVVDGLDKLDGLDVRDFKKRTYLNAVSVMTLN